MTYDPATTEAQEREEDRLDAITIAFETAALAIIASALGRITPDTTYTDALIAQAADMAELERLAFQCEQDLYTAIAEAFDRMAVGNDAWAAGQYEYAKKAPIKTTDNIAMKSSLTKAKHDAQRGALSLVNTSAVGIGRGKTWKPFTEVYREAVSRGISAMAVGEATYDQSIAQATRELARSGLRVLYPSGRTLDVNAAVRMWTMDGYRDEMARLRELHGVEFEADGVEVSAHYMCAPDHLPYQGKQYTRAEFEKLNETDLAGRPITTGANCRHTAYAVRYGSPRAISGNQLREMNAQSKRKVTFTGAGGKPLTMTAYESTQYQRQLERSVRAYKTEAYLAKKENNEALRKAANSKARAASAYYRSMCEEAGLTPRPKRMQIHAE